MEATKNLLAVFAGSAAGARHFERLLMADFPPGQLVDRITELVQLVIDTVAGDG